MSQLMMIMIRKTHQTRVRIIESVCSKAKVICVPGLRMADI
jgi:hypothetical protein